MNKQASVVYQATDLNNALMSENKTRGAKVANPNTGKLSFGRIPENNNGIASGEIYLKLGFIGTGRDRKGAFGARHIWEKHKTDLSIKSPEDTASVIASILKDGANVLVDFNAPHTPQRPVVLNTAIGRVALIGYREPGGEYAYSIVSAYGNKNAPGTVIGTLEPPKN